MRACARRRATERPRRAARGRAAGPRHDGCGSRARQRGATEHVPQVAAQGCVLADHVLRDKFMADQAFLCCSGGQAEQRRELRADVGQPRCAHAGTGEGYRSRRRVDAADEDKPAMRDHRTIDQKRQVSEANALQIIGATPAMAPPQLPPEVRQNSDTCFTRSRQHPRSGPQRSISSLPQPAPAPFARPQSRPRARHPSRRSRRRS